jgi:hypothetical protein
MAEHGTLRNYRDLEFTASANALASLGERLEETLPTECWARVNDNSPP